jgi:hypothetical protein
LSTTGSLEEPYYDFTPPGGGQTTYSGGIGAYQGNTWVYNTWRNQFNAKVTHYTDDFMGAQHDCWIGSCVVHPAHRSTGSSYISAYYYRDRTPTVWRVSGSGLFIDDSITIGDRLTINAGVRFDHNHGWVPDYDRLTIGNNTDFSPAGFFEPTGATVPGLTSTTGTTSPPGSVLPFSPTKRDAPSSAGRSASTTTRT